MTMTSLYGPVLRKHLPPGKAFEAPDSSSTLAPQPLISGANVGVSGNSGLVAGGGYIWVACTGGDLVQLNALTGAVTATLAIAGSPKGVVWDGAHPWVIQNTGNSISRYNGASFDTAVSVGNGPNFGCFDGTNIWVTNKTDGTVSVVNVASRTVIATYTVGSNPMGIIFDGTNIWVANNGDGTVTKILASTGATLGVFQIGTNPFNLAYDGALIWVTDTGTSKVYALLATSGTVVNTISGVFNAPEGIVYDGVSIWVGDIVNGVAQILAANGVVVQSGLVGGTTPSVMCFDSVNRNVWVSQGSSTIVSAFTAGGAAFVGVSTMAMLLNALGRTYDRWKVTVDELLTEFDPRTTQLLLPDWEAAFGLPGSNPTPPTTIAGRQKALFEKEQGYNTVNAAFVKQIALNLGYTITVWQVVFPQCFCNSPCNAVLNTDPWQFVWFVYYTPGSLDATLQWAINNIVPAHTLVVFVPNQKPSPLINVLRSSAISSGIIASYMLTEGSGTAAKDNSLYHNDLTLQGSPLPSWVTTGSYGPALSFGALANSTRGQTSGSPSGIQLPISGLISFNPTAIGSSQQILLQLGTTILVYLQSGKVFLANNTTSCSLNITTGAQHLVAFTITSGGVGILYLDTSTNTATATIGSTAPGQITLGNGSGGANCCNSVIDLAVVWNNRVLAAADVATLFANPFAPETGR